MTAEHVGDENPFVTIWEAPRATIRRIVDGDPRRHVNLLFFCAGAIAVARAIVGRSELDELPLQSVIVPIACLAGGAMSIPFSHLNAWYRRWVGGLLGGAATRAEVAAVVAWSTVPSIVGGAALWLAELALFGTEIFHPDHPALDAASPLLLTSGYLASVLFGLWSATISVVGFAEVNRFSVLRSIGASILGFTIVGITVVVMAAILFVAVFRGSWH